MHQKIRRHLLTIMISALLGLSVVTMILGSAGLVANNGLWRLLVVPAYLIMLGSAILATALSMPNNPLFWAICTAVLLLPFVIVDAIRARSSRSDPPAA